MADFVGDAVGNAIGVVDAVGDVIGVIDAGGDINGCDGRYRGGGKMGKTYGRTIQRKFLIRRDDASKRKLDAAKRRLWTRRESPPAASCRLSPPPAAS